MLVSGRATPLISRVKVDASEFPMVFSANFIGADRDTGLKHRSQDSGRLIITLVVPYLEDHPS